MAALLLKTLITRPLGTPVGMQPGVSGDGRRGIVTELGADRKALVMRHIDLTDGHELDRWDGRRQHVITRMASCV